MTALHIESIEESTVDWRYKGLPPDLVPTPLRTLGTLGLDVLGQDLVFPVALLKRGAIAHNRQWMQRFLAATGTKICPHGKTTMAPQLFAQQMADGAWGMTAATVSHVRVYREFGVQRILFANQLLGTEELRYILEEIARDPNFDFFCLVDSLQGLALLRDAVERHRPGRPLQVLIELGIPGGRTGVRDAAGTLALVQAIRACGPGIALRGVEVYEGIAPGNAEEAEAHIEAVLRRVVAVTRAGIEGNWFADGEVIVSAGGSAYFDLAAAMLAGVSDKRTVTTVLRSGCYLTHDDKLYADYFRRIEGRPGFPPGLGPGLRPALELCAAIQSMPEPGLMIAGFGKRDASYDVHLPTALWWFRPGLHASVQALPVAVGVKGLNDQHAYLAVPDPHPFAVGDLLGFGISHPCTTFDKWRMLFVVDDDYKVVDGVKTFF